MKLMRIIPLLPWWLLAKALHFERFERDYDWSLSGITRSPFRCRRYRPRVGLLGDCGWGVLLLLAYQTAKRESRMNRKCKQCGGIIGSATGDNLHVSITSGGYRRTGSSSLQHRQSSAT